MRFPRRNKPNSNSFNGGNDGVNNENSRPGVESMSSVMKSSIVSEASSELRLLTRKHTFFGSKRSTMSMITSKKDKTLITFTTMIDSIDGIIASRSGRPSLIGQRSKPIFAVITYQKKVMTTGRTVNTNFLSHPLMKSNSSIGNRERFYAKFSDDSEPQTFSLTAAMRRDSSYKSGFEPRELDFEIGLMQGSEVVRLGSSTLILGGDEDGSMQMIAVNCSKAITNTVRKAMTANKPTKTCVSSVSTSGAKMVSFTSDPTRKYTLQRSVMRLAVHVQGPDSNQSQYLSDPSNVPSSMMLSIGNSDSVSCLSSGGVTTSILKERCFNPKLNSKGTIGFKRTQPLNNDDIDLSFTMTNSSTQDDESTLNTGAMTKSTIQMRGNNCIGNGLRLLESKSSSDSSTTTNVPSFESSVTREMLSEDDETTLLDEVSIGTIKFKDVNASDGFEVITANQNKMLRTESDILG